jgi:hypothetical protein
LKINEKAKKNEGGSGLRIADCGIRIENRLTTIPKSEIRNEQDCGLKKKQINTNCHNSEIQNPKSEIQNQGRKQQTLKN